jgi:hypothetical protein
MADEVQSSKEAKGYSTPNRQGEYSRLAKLLPRAFERLAELLESNNPNIAMGAVNTILDRTIPKIKGLELTNGVDDDGKPRPFQLLINAGSGFIPATIQFNASSKGSDTKESQEIQDAHLAPTSEEDNNSNLRDSEAGPS